MNGTIESASLAGTFEKQLRLLRELSNDLVVCRAAFVSMDLDGVYQHIATQSALCDQLRQTEEERRTVWRATCAASGIDLDAGDLQVWIAGLDPKVGEHVRGILTELALAEAELRHLNRTHTVLVEGSRRTLGILANVLASFAPTYARPQGRADSATAANGGAHK